MKCQIHLQRLFSYVGNDRHTALSKLTFTCLRKFQVAYKLYTPWVWPVHTGSKIVVIVQILTCPYERSP